MDDFWAPPRCEAPVVIEEWNVRWCHLDKGHTADQHETTWDRRTYRWPTNERSTTA